MCLYPCMDTYLPRQNFFFELLASAPGSEPPPLSLAGKLAPPTQHQNNMAEGSAKSRKQAPSNKNQGGKGKSGPAGSKSGSSINKNMQTGLKEVRGVVTKDQVLSYPSGRIRISSITDPENDPNPLLRQLTTRFWPCSKM